MASHNHIGNLHVFIKAFVQEVVDKGIISVSTISSDSIVILMMSVTEHIREKIIKQIPVRHLGISKEIAHFLEVGNERVKPLIESILIVHT